MYEFSKHAIRLPCEKCAATFSVERPLDRYRPTLAVLDGGRLQVCNSADAYVCLRCLARQHSAVALKAV
ncbi:hypothetical protein EMGBS3_00640 [Anaerolineaceae bacterium]|nr:hypothetical protein EMGBS3_00640 [Anaerolineaceae bacterium]GBL38028.1 hypothetical protein EMGBD1_17150 [Anaerolineaceae bacterium]